MSKVVNLIHKDTTDSDTLYIFPSQEELLGELMKQRSLEEAETLASEINELNEYDVVSRWDMELIRKHYIEQEEKYRELQKGYMALFSK